jgi:predicted MFS family arabinose efflux permease
VGYLSEWGWRTSLLLVVVPVSLLIFILSRLGIPDPEKSSSQNISLMELFAGYGTVFRNKSAIGCILGTVLGMANWSLYLVYGASYWRQEFLLSTNSISYSMFFVIFGFIAGSLGSGKLVDSLGSKRSLLVSTGVLGLVTLFAFNAPSFLVSFVLSFIASICAGIVVTVSSSFSLEQIPEYQGTMMSLYSAADSLGTTVSATLGGYLLLVYGYGSCSLVMGVMGLLSALAYQYLTTNPQ